jgi:death-on-curing family protein
MLWWVGSVSSSPRLPYQSESKRKRAKKEALKLLSRARLPTSPTPASPDVATRNRPLRILSPALPTTASWASAPAARATPAARLPTTEAQDIEVSASPVSKPTAIPVSPKKKRHTKERALAQGPLKHQYDLPIVGNPSTAQIHHLDARRILDIHNQLVEDFAYSPDPIEPSGPRDLSFAQTRDGTQCGNLLESAATRPKTSLAGKQKYPTVEMAAAALLHALVHDHPFHNGNKRTGIVAMLVFLDLNGYLLEATEEDIFNYVLALAAHEGGQGDRSGRRSFIMSDSDRETLQAAEWIKRHSRKLNKSQTTLKWLPLKGILRHYGCTFEQRSGNRIVIRRGKLMVHTGSRNDGHEMAAETIADVRKALELDEAHGIDSTSFYFKGDPVPEFIHRYRKLLSRLAPL